jgi:mannose-6-phosphate isomerase-like protein (cupin superfamily)
VTEKKPFIVRLEKVNKHQSLLQGDPQTCGMQAGRVLLLPNQDCGEHSTKSYEELLIFLVGEGEVIIENNASLQVGAKRICYIPPETIHNVRNTGNEPLIYIYCVTPVLKQRCIRS